MPVIGYKFYGRNVRPYFHSPEKKSHTILGMTLFSLIVFGVFAIRPSLSTISRLNSEVKKAQEAKTLLDQKINDLSQAQVNFQLAAEDLKLVDQALPKDTGVPSILETVAAAAGRNNLILEETAFSETGKETGLKTLPFTVRAGGELKNVEKFISELEEGIRQMDVQKVRMNRGGEELEEMTVEIELVVHFHE